MAAVTISAIERLRENDLRQITRRLRLGNGASRRARAGMKTSGHEK
jgi:hypothetical protein